MVVIEGKNSLRFYPQGDRFTYHTAEDPAVELDSLKNVLACCDKLGQAFLNIFANVQLGSLWWTKALILTADAEGRVAITEIRDKANTMLANATIRRSALKQIKNGFPNGLFFYGTMDAFPPEDTTPTGPANDPMMSFTVELTDAALREYYIGTDGKLHCQGLLPVYMNDKPLVLTDGDFVDGGVEVVYAVDFIPK